MDVMRLKNKQENKGPLGGGSYRHATFTIMFIFRFVSFTTLSRLQWYCLECMISITPVYQEIYNLRIDYKNAIFGMETIRSEISFILISLPYTLLP